MAKNNNITITQLSQKMQKTLNQYASNITGKVKTLAKETAIELTKNTKRDSPVKTGQYKRHINYKKTRETSTNAVYIWYVKDPEYRLTHLLAKKHRKKNGGWVKANAYLSKNVTEAKKKFIRDVKEIIENEH